MNKEEIEWLISTPTAKQKIFFLALIHNLTVAMRCVCHEGDGAGIGLERSRKINELIHAASGYLLKICFSRESEDWARLTAEAFFSNTDPVLKEQIDLSWKYAKQDL